MVYVSTLKNNFLYISQTYFHPGTFTFPAGISSGSKSTWPGWDFFLAHTFVLKRFRNISRESGLGGRVKIFPQFVISSKRLIPTNWYFLWITTQPFSIHGKQRRHSRAFVILYLEFLGKNQSAGKDPVHWHLTLK